jgi:hypothetical protein
LKAVFPWLNALRRRRSPTAGHWEADSSCSPNTVRPSAVHERRHAIILATRPPRQKPPSVSHGISSLFTPCRSSCARPSPSTTAPSSPPLAAARARDRDLLL